VTVVSAPTQPSSARILPEQDQPRETHLPSQIDAATPPGALPLAAAAQSSGGQEQRALAGFKAAAGRVPGPADLSLRGQTVADAATNARNAMQRPDLPPELSAQVKDTLIEVGNQLADGQPLPAMTGDFREHLYALVHQPINIGTK
jgi:hypothetical protein